MKKRLIRRRKYSGSKWLFFCSLILVLGIMMIQITPTVAANNLDKAQNGQSWEVVRVEKGDTLWKIAERYRQPRQDIRLLIDRIQEANDLKPSEFIYPGQLLIVPVK